MSKSFEWAINRAKANADNEPYVGRDWSAAKELDIGEYLVDTEDDPFSRIHSITYDTKYALDAKVTVDIDPEYDGFEYTVVVTKVHDGTYPWVRQTIADAVERVIYARSYKTELGEPKNGDWVHYVIGNLVVLHEKDGDWVPANKQWMNTRSTVILPVKMWYEERKCDND